MKVLRTVAIVLGIEALLAGAGYVWVNVHEDDPLETVQVSKAWIAKLAAERDQEQAKVQELLGEMEKMQKLIQNLMLSRST